MALFQFGMFAAAFTDLRSHSFPLPLTLFSGRKVKMKKYDGIYLVLMLSAFFAGGGMGRVSVIFPAAVLDISFLTVLILAGRQDMRELKIADQWQLLLLGLAATACLLEPEPLFFSRAFGFFCVSAPFLVIALAVPGAIGGGDIKLTAVCGLFLGWKAAVVSAAAGIVLGGAWGLCMLALGKLGRKEHFPMGPFLCMGMAFGIYGGNPVFEWFFHVQ